MTINLRNVKKYLITELELSDEESEIFLFIVKGGKANIEKIAKSFKSPRKIVFDSLVSLVEKGMIIEISANEYESLHPKFAVVNLYRRLCLDNNLQFKKNVLIDNIGTILERPFEDARSK